MNQTFTMGRLNSLYYGHKKIKSLKVHQKIKVNKQKNLYKQILKQELQDFVLLYYNYSIKE